MDPKNAFCLNCLIFYHNLFDKKRKDCVFFIPLIKKYGSKTGFMQDENLHKRQSNNQNIFIVRNKEYLKQ